MLDLDNLPETDAAADTLEEVVMGLIINAGQARSLAYNALKQAKLGDFETAKTLMEQSHAALHEAHRVQTQLIESDEGRVR
jgi:PTS system cellobiose-specific IIA component